MPASPTISSQSELYRLARPRDWLRKSSWRDCNTPWPQTAAAPEKAKGYRTSPLPWPQLQTIELRTEPVDRRAQVAAREPVDRKAQVAAREWADYKVRFVEREQLKPAQLSLLSNHSTHHRGPDWSSTNARCTIRLPGQTANSQPLAAVVQPQALPI